MIDTVNGVPLLGTWHVLDGAQYRSALSFAVESSESAGRDGVVAQGSTRQATTLSLLIGSTPADVDHLYALFAAPSLVLADSSRPGLSLTGRLLSSAPSVVKPWLSLEAHSFVVEVADGAWRGTVSTSALVSASALGAELTVWPGLSAPVQDALIRLKGPLQNPQVTDVSGAFFALSGSLTGSEYLRFDSATGRAWVTTSDTWSGGSEVSGQVDYGGPRDVFEVTPFMASPSAPGVRVGKLTLSQLSLDSGSGFQVRGRSAHLM